MIASAGRALRANRRSSSMNLNACGLRATLFLSAMSWQVAHGQLDVPGPLVLSGVAPDQRQVLGLGAPQSSDAAVSAGDLRSATVSRGDAQGAALLTVDLFPAPLSYSPGMVVQLTPLETNSSAPQLDVNGLGARDLVKWGGTPLDSADLQAGVPVRLVYDGDRFLLLGDVRLTCDPGFVAVANDHCIESQSRTAADFFDANLQCAAMGARLCTLAEWSRGCSVVPGFMTTVLDMEWVDSAANNTDYAKTMGTGDDGAGNSGTGCTYGGLRLPTIPNRFRCCMNK